MLCETYGLVAVDTGDDEGDICLAVLDDSNRIRYAYTEESLRQDPNMNPAIKRALLETLQETKRDHGMPPRTMTARLM